MVGEMVVFDTVSDVVVLGDIEVVVMVVSLWQKSFSTRKSVAPSY